MDISAYSALAVVDYTRIMNITRTVASTRFWNSKHVSLDYGRRRNERREHKKCLHKKRSHGLVCIPRPVTNGSMVHVLIGRGEAT